mmetsp:Transcript_14459/g.47926  ORF Transcript_14459/g.47926 Transcript_14459/m.47926 type:complete len:226 (-) Transcript_14459:274-951(-)
MCVSVIHKKNALSLARMLLSKLFASARHSGRDTQTVQNPGSFCPDASLRPNGAPAGFSHRHTRMSASIEKYERLSESAPAHKPCASGCPSKASPELAACAAAIASTSSTKDSSDSTRSSQRAFRMSKRVVGVRVKNEAAPRRGWPRGLSRSSSFSFSFSLSSSSSSVRKSSSSASSSSLSPGTVFGSRVSPGIPFSVPGIPVSSPGTASSSSPESTSGSGYPSSK